MAPPAKGDGRRQGSPGGAGGLAVITGSGMGALEDGLGGRFRPAEEVAFDRIEGLGACTVAGHRGVVRLGTANGRRFALVFGRRHFYEGAAPAMLPLLEWLAGRGIGDVVAVSAAGAVRATYRPGELVVITDVIDLQNCPLSLPAMTGRRAALTARAGTSPRLRHGLEAAARNAGVALHRGVLACGAGPAYETRAEIRALQEMGVDVATMSAAPEIQYAKQVGMDIAIVAAITNAGTGIGGEPPDHDRVLAVAAGMSGRMGEVLIGLLEHL